MHPCKRVHAQAARILHIEQAIKGQIHFMDGAVQATIESGATYTRQGPNGMTRRAGIFAEPAVT